MGLIIHVMCCFVPEGLEVGTVSNQPRGPAMTILRVEDTKGHAYARARARHWSYRFRLQALDPSWARRIASSLSDWDLPQQLDKLIVNAGDRIISKTVADHYEHVSQ